MGPRKELRRHRAHILGYKRRTVGGAVYLGTKAQGTGKGHYL